MYAGMKPDYTTISGNKPMITGLVLSYQRLLENSENTITVLGVDMVDPEAGLVTPLLNGIAEHLLCFSTDHAEPKVPIRFPDNAMIDPFGQIPVALLCNVGFSTRGLFP